MRKLRPSVLVLVTLLTAVAPAAAIDVPQTREEFVQAIASGRGAGPEAMRVEQPLENVYAVLEERLAACLDKKVERTAYVGYVERSSTDYNPTLRRLGGDGAEFTLQVEHRPRPVGGTIPTGGLFMMAADIRSSGGGTEIVLYRPKIGAGKITESLKQWLSGQPAACPKLR